jgi:hypothetical protein
MENLTKAIKNVVEGFRSLHILAFQVRIGPRHMKTIEKHGAYNASAIVVIGALLTLSTGLYSPFSTNGITTGLLSALLSVAIVGVIGTVVNFIEPASTVFADDTPDVLENRAAGLANKWATYFALNFVIMILLFLAGNGISVSLWDGRSMVGFLIYNGLSYYLSTIIVTFFVSFVSVAIVFLFCRKAGKIVDGKGALISIFIWTNIVCSALFYYIQFHIGYYFSA